MSKPALEVDKNTGTLKLSGSLTIATAAELYRQLQSLLAIELPKTLTLDCQQIGNADSAAIGLLVEAHRQLSAGDKVLSIVGLSEKLSSLVHLYGVEWILSPPSAQPSPQSTNATLLPDE
ncbi:MAG: STAS domain-containing protein [Gammaproteobacteria bacterium]|nr:STAS domain-containing protein [Gammaproteobacteria bacterium]